jgi:CRISPR-associated protein Csm1
LDEVKHALVAYGLEKLASVTGGDAAELLSDLGEIPVVNWQGYEDLLGGTGQQEEEVLSSIFSRVVLRDDAHPPLTYLAAQSLALNEKTLFPVSPETARAGSKLDELWSGFAGEYDQLRQRFGQDADAFFEGFYHLYHKWAWAVPCTHGERGVSLFQQWKAVAALVFATREKWADRPAGDFTLIGGDIPGIQDFVYTITSKGAAKGLRGRSFFIQLLGDAIVRRLLADLGLPEANVIYAAGGNFMLLAPVGEETEKTVRRVLRQVNARLVEAIQGDTALVLKSMPVEASDLFTPGRFKGIRDEFGEKIAKAKAQPLRELTDDWATLFKPKGKGSRLSCAVCRIEVDEQSSKPLERTGEVPEGTEPPRICYLCDSFAELARNIRHENLWMTIAEKPEMLETEVQPKDRWTDILEQATGFSYEFNKPQPAGGSTVLALNRLDFLKADAHGFRLLANVTPKTTNDDIRYLRDEAKWEEKDIPEKDDIRSFTLLAHAAATAGAIERVGVLRMDVDGLGRVFSEGVPDLTLPKLSALSGALDLFFGGYLNVLVRAQADIDLYIIYAGGDDLFIVGAWHHLPDLAEAIRNQFKAFTGNNSVLSLSGGITLEGAKFPLYRAAERAGEAEGKAKGHTRPDGGAKDALCFLDTVVGWEDWELVRSQKDELLWLVGEDERNRAKKEAERERRLPRGLLQNIQSIHRLYRTGLRDARRRIRRDNRKRPPDKKLPLPKPKLFFGRWAWMKVYSLTRLADRSKKRVPDAPERIEQLQKEIMQPATVRYSGLAARWAEYQTRKEVRS